MYGNRSRLDNNIPSANYGLFSAASLRHNRCDNTYDHKIPATHTSQRLCDSIAPSLNHAARHRLFGTAFTSFTL
jgi:hypothetical protein